MIRFLATTRHAGNGLAESHPNEFAELKSKWDAWADKIGVLTPEQFDQARNAVRERKRKQ